MSAVVLHRKLHHKTPGWVPAGERYHIRLRIEGAQRPLTDSGLAPHLLDSAVLYHDRRRWHAWVFLLMPDHLHAVMSFSPDVSMSRVVGDWKHYQKRQHGIVWQEGYFDHRLRNAEQAVVKCHYIRMNPVRRGLCKVPEEWPWVVEPWRRDFRDGSAGGGVIHPRSLGV